jgi:polar amino acid transport system substrate-binding protein
VLNGSYDTLMVALAVPKGRTAAAEYLSRLLEELKASGFIKESMVRSGLRGTKVAAPKQP